MRRALIYAAVALLAVLVWWGSQPSYTEADAKEARSDSSWRANLVREHALADAVRWEMLRNATLSTERDSLAKVADKAQAARPAVLQRIKEVAGDSAAVVAEVLQLDSLHQVERTALRAQLLDADLQSAAKDSVISQYQRVNADLRLAVSTARSSARAWMDVAQPKFLGLRIKPGVAIGVGFALGVATVVLAR